MSEGTATHRDAWTVTGGALIVLALGALLLVAGGSAFATSPAELSLWTVTTGLVVLLGAMALILLRTPSRAPAASRAPASVPARLSATESPAVAPVPTEELESEARTPAPERSPPEPITPARRAVSIAAAMARGEGAVSPRSSSTSIPGAYLEALSTSRGSNQAWQEVAPPIAAALPFSAGVRRPVDPGAPWDEGGDVGPSDPPRVELELARLRAQVRDLEGRRTTPSAAPGAIRPTISVAPAAAPRPEPPAPPTAASVQGRACSACGTTLPSAAAPLLCWGCGRGLCTGCYWRFGPGPGLHRCPECQAQSSSAAISGGVAWRAPSGAAPAAVPAGAPPVALGGR